ncbi:MAG: hypothetical protein R3Y63_10840 [Eubacteriales bacterium]
MEQVTISLDSTVLFTLESYLEKVGMSWNSLMEQTLEHCPLDEETLSAIRETIETEDSLKGYNDLDELFKDLKS